MRLPEVDVYHRALKQYGLHNQVIKCIEELSELQKELCKQLWGQGNRENIVEEIADVKIMLEQMRIGIGIGFIELETARDEKLARLNKRLDQSRVKEEDAKTEFEKKCQQCRYYSMAGDELQVLGGEDPCETCKNLSNWKPKEDAHDRR